MLFEFKQYSMDEPCYQQAWKLRDQVLRHPLGLSLTRQDRDLDARCWHYGLFKGGQICATVTVQPLSDSKQTTQQVKLRQMVVSPVHQNQGLGQTLIQKVEKALKSQSIQSISMAARLPAVKFYQKLGFQTQGPIYHHLNIDHQDMHKDLNSI